MSAYIKRMEALEDALHGLIKACGELDAKSVSQDFHRAYSVASNALEGFDWIGGRFVPRFGTCTRPHPEDNGTVTDCIRKGHCGCDEKEKRT